MAYTIPNAHTFILRGHDTTAAQNIVTIDATEVVTLSMDFANVVNGGAFLSSVTSVVTVDAAGDDAGVSTNQAVDDDIYRATWNTPSLTAGGYVVTVTVVTDDNETLVGVGILQVI